MLKDIFVESLMVHEAAASDAALSSASRRRFMLLPRRFSMAINFSLRGMGECADAQHFATEFTATLKKEQRKGYPALALTTDTSFLTAWTNDFGVKEIFARQVEALGKKDDVFVGISTSGNSENIVEAAKMAQQKGLHVIGLLGNGGGALKELVHTALIVPSPVTARIQEVHILLLHAIADEVITRLMNKS